MKIHLTMILQLKNIHLINMVNLACLYASCDDFTWMYWYAADLDTNEP